MLIKPNDVETVRVKLKSDNPKSDIYDNAELLYQAGFSEREAIELALRHQAFMADYFTQEQLRRRRYD